MSNAARKQPGMKGAFPVAGFFESIAALQDKRPLLAAWIIEGRGAGGKALFDRNGLLFRDECFPEAFARKAQETGKAGILETEGARVFLEKLSNGKRLCCTLGSDRPSHSSSRLTRAAYTEA